MSAPGIPDMPISCVMPGCGHVITCVTTLVDVERSTDGAPVLLVRIDTAPFIAHQRIHHPTTGAAQ